MWLLRELRAQARGAGLLLALASAGVVGVSALLPTVDAELLSNPNTVEGGLRLTLIQNALGWVVVATALAVVATVAVAVARRARLFPASLLLGLGLGVMAIAGSLAGSNLLDACNPNATVHVRGDIACEQSAEWGHRVRFEPGLAFDVMNLGGAGAALAGALILSGVQSQRSRRRSFAGRQPVVWI